MFVNGDTSPEKKQPGLNRLVVVVIDGLLFHYDIHNGTLYKYPLHYLVWDRQEEMKCLVRNEKIYGVKPKFQENSMNRLRNIKHFSLNIGCICVEKKQCLLSRWEKYCSNKCSYLECGGNGKPKTTVTKFTDNKNYICMKPTIVKNKNFRRKQKNKEYIT